VFEVHTDELGFATAMPELIFMEIFSNLSPAYLFHFCRFVCKSWKSLIDEHLVYFLTQKAFVQVLMTKEVPASVLNPDVNYIEFSTIYRAVAARCSDSSTFYDTDDFGFPHNSVIIYKPLNEGRPFTFEYLPRHSLELSQWDFVDFKIHHAVSSLFPEGRRWIAKIKKSYVFGKIKEVDRYLRTGLSVDR
jgi:hypothetical protein